MIQVKLKFQRNEIRNRKSHIDQNIRLQEPEQKPLFWTLLA